MADVNFKSNSGVDVAEFEKFLQMIGMLERAGLVTKEGYRLKSPLSSEPTYEQAQLAFLNQADRTAVPHLVSDR